MFKFMNCFLITLLYCFALTQTAYAANDVGKQNQKQDQKNLKQDQNKNQEQSKKQDQSQNKQSQLSPAEALQRLMDGNTRFSEDKSMCAERNEARRQATVAKQLPFAVILGCSDSRFPPEIAFDQGIGDIFVVRVAGNVVSEIELSSIEYSAVHNHSSIIVVVGHQNCGAVDAVVQNQAEEMPAIASLIQPSVKVAKSEKDFTLRKAIEANVKNSVRRIRTSPAIQKLISEKKIDVVGGYYNLDSGKVEILDIPT